MASCDAIMGLAEHAIAHAALGVAGGGQSSKIRRDVLANRGTAADHQRELFLEDRDLLGKQDVLWISHGNGVGGWIWDSMFRWGGV